MPEDMRTAQGLPDALATSEKHQQVIPAVRYPATPEETVDTSVRDPILNCARCVLGQVMAHNESSPADQQLPLTISASLIAICLRRQTANVYSSLSLRVETGFLEVISHPSHSSPGHATQFAPTDKLREVGVFEPNPNCGGNLERKLRGERNPNTPRRPFTENQLRMGKCILCLERRRTLGEAFPVTTARVRKCTGFEGVHFRRFVSDEVLDGDSSAKAFRLTEPGRPVLVAALEGRHNWEDDCDVRTTPPDKVRKERAPRTRRSNKKSTSKVESPTGGQDQDVQVPDPQDTPLVESPQRALFDKIAFWLGTPGMTDQLAMLYPGLDKYSPEQLQEFIDEVKQTYSPGEVLPRYLIAWVRNHEPRKSENT